MQVTWQPHPERTNLGTETTVTGRGTAQGGFDASDTSDKLSGIEGTKMGLFGNMFGGGKQFTPILTRTQDNLFRIHGVPNPSDAQKIKACVYLCVSGIAILNDLGKGALNESIDRLLEDSRNLAKPFRAPVRDLANDSLQLQLIMSDFPSELEIVEATKVNGLAAFEAMYFALGEEMMGDILAHKNGPMGIPGYAAVVISKGLFGRARAEEHFMETSIEIVNFTTSIAEAI